MVDDDEHQSERSMGRAVLALEGGQAVSWGAWRDEGGTPRIHVSHAFVSHFFAYRLRSPQEFASLRPTEDAHYRPWVQRLRLAVVRGPPLPKRLP